jgi:hypothetical protein
MENVLKYVKGIVGIFCTLFLVFCSGVGNNEDSGTVLINEFMVRNSATSPYMDCLGQHGDWVELYNPGPESVEMSNFYLSDRIGNLNKYQLYDTVIPAGGLYLLWSGDTATDSAVCEHHNHFDFGFDWNDTNNVEMVIISNEDGDIIDSVSFVGIPAATKVDTSYGRYPDGSANWQTQNTSTPGTANVGY